jgi:hypothetical protein
MGARGTNSWHRRAVAWRQTHKSFTNPAIIVPSLAFPLVFLTAFAGGLSAVSKVPGFGYPAGLHGLPVRVRLPRAAAFGQFFVGLSIAADLVRVRPSLVSGHTAPQRAVHRLRDRAMLRLE